MKLDDFRISGTKIISEIKAGKNKNENITSNLNGQNNQMKDVATTENNLVIIITSKIKTMLLFCFNKTSS